MTADSIHTRFVVLMAYDQSYLVLSGGLGSSAYVKDRIAAHYKTGPGSTKPGVTTMQVAMVAEP